MTEQSSQKHQNPDDQQGFPIQLKLLLAVIGLALFGVMLKVAGII